MSHQSIIIPKAAAAVGPYSHGYRSGNLVFFSGQIPVTTDGKIVSSDISTQTKQVLANLDILLKGIKANRSQVVKTTIFMTDINDYVLVNDLYAKFFDNHRPARSCVQVSALPKNAQIEIEMIVSLEQN